MAMAENIVMSEMTWMEVDEALKDRPVAILPLGATEAHGPHLPITADSLIAVEMAKRTAAKLKEHGVSALILPPVGFAVSEFAASFAGTVTISPETSVGLIKDICVSAGKRFRAVAIANIHLEPRHLECVKTAVEEARKAGASVCWPDITKKRWADTLPDSFRAGDHAGAFETSLVMSAAPDMVRERERISLAPMDPLMPALKKGAKTFVEAGGEDAYFGDPTSASAEDGDTHFEALGEILSLSIMEHLGSKA